MLPEAKETKRMFRLDTGINVFDELTAVFDDVGMEHAPVIGSPKESVDSDGDTTIVHVPNVKEEMRVLFGKRNIVSLLNLKGSDVILDQCIQLPFLSRFILRYKEATEGTAFTMPSTLSEALTLKNRSVLRTIDKLQLIYNIDLEAYRQHVAMQMCCCDANV